MTPHTIIFIGPQGSGKGTQVAMLEAKLRKAGSAVMNLQTGKPFRELAARGGYAADIVAERLAAGQLIPDFFTNALVTKELVDQLTPEMHLLLDGYPRNRAQAEVVEVMLTFFKRPSLTIIHLDTPDEIVQERMQSRGRNDDTPAAITERLRLYHAETEPLVAYYRARPDTNFIHIDGAPPIETVTKQIHDALQLTA
jgi:adenylate kinase